MNRKKSRKIVSYFTIIMIAVISIGISAVRCAMQIELNFQNQLIQNLEDVAWQNASLMEGLINSKYDLLKSVAARFEMEPDKRIENLSSFLPVVETYHLKRIGFCDTDGLSHATQGDSTYLVHREFFQKGMAGENSISDVLRDAMDEAHGDVIVMSMPLYDKTHTVDGVASLTYETYILSDELSTDSFNGFGKSFLITERGQIIVSSDTSLMQISENLFTDVLPKNAQNDSVTQKLLQSAQRKEATDGVIYLNNQSFQFEIVPVFLMDDSVTWYVITLIPSNYMQLRFEPVKRHLTRMVILISAICILCAIVSRLFSIRQRNMAYALAYESQLTGGPNLVRFLQIMQEKKEKVGYVVVMNIEKFSLINSAAGKVKSDELLKIIWNILSSMFRTEECAGHDKADTFVLYMRDSTQESLQERLTWLHNTCNKAALDMQIPWVNLRFGVYQLQGEDSAEDAYGKAAVAMKEVRGQKEFWSFYDEENYKKQLLDQSIIDRFKIALKEREFEVWYQPKYSVDGSKLTGCEALVRWRNQDGSLMPPGVFIPVLEQDGKIAELDEYVFNQVCKQQKTWIQAGYKAVPVSINVSRASLYRKDIINDYCDILKNNALDMQYVQLEVTETVVSSSANIAKLLSEFRELGIKILMDDFGTGYSSLATLSLKCFDTIKIDKSLVDMTGDAYGKTLLAKCIDLGRSLGMHITVEGVETEEQLCFLKDTGCDDIQGYYFSKPIPAGDFEGRMEKENA